MNSQTLVAKPVSNLFGTNREREIVSSLRKLAGGPLFDERRLVDQISQLERSGKIVNVESASHRFIDGTVSFPNNTRDDFYLSVIGEEWTIGWGNGWGKTWNE